MPKVSIVVACYNAQPHLAAAMESVVDQTFQDWELIIVNDGSTDNSGSYLRDLADRDSRVTVVEQTNQGQNAAADVGISLAKAPLIARMDSDDICEVDRLEKQVAFMDQHPEVGLLGGQIRRLGEVKSGLESNFPTKHEEIVSALLKNHHAICNPTILFRKKLFDQIGGYWKHDIAEDWDMFLRMGEVSELANMSDVVLSYRFHASSINGRRIVEAQLYNEYAAFLAEQRAQGQVESSFEEFYANHRCNRWPTSWAFIADSHSIGQYRKAIAELYGGRTFSGMSRLVLSMVMSPGRATRRVGNMLRRYRPTSPDHAYAVPVDSLSSDDDADLAADPPAELATTAETTSVDA